MPNLRGASPVGRVVGGQSYAARMGGSRGLSMLHHVGEGHSPVKMENSERRRQVGSTGLQEGRVRRRKTRKGWTPMR